MKYITIKRLGIVLFLFIVSCKNTTVNDKIVVTVGDFEDRYSERYGIELKMDTLFLCVEDKPGNMNYLYYYSPIKADTLNKYRDLFTENFDHVLNFDVEDGFELQISYQTNGTLKYFNARNEACFDEKQKIILKEFMSLRTKFVFRRISKHQFPKELLYKKPKRFTPPS